VEKTVFSLKPKPNGDRPTIGADASTRSILLRWLAFILGFSWEETRFVYHGFDPATEPT
jgi:hypothetical protein